jgi:predicted acylesterase/phospholipase RssA
MASFKIGINMAGAISAGAYTAGVLDFLTEALDEWYAAKKRGEAVPMHDVSIEVFSGASAGGMCAAISSVMLYQDFQHIHNVNQRDTNNIFYESWVNTIDIVPLLETGDLSKRAPVDSLLNSNIIDDIANNVLNPAKSAPVLRPYVSSTLTLFLSLTNLRGVPYSLNGEAPGSIEETTFFYGDRIRFQTVNSSTAPVESAVAHALDLSDGNAPGWQLLKTAAMATGAFPVFLKPRILDRELEEYIPPGWESVLSAVSGTPPPIAPTIPPKDGHPYVTLNVDGGVTNNDPFNYAHDYLMSLDPPVDESVSSQDPFMVDRAVIGIAPFPTTDAFDPNFNAQSGSAVVAALPRLFNALIGQARFFGESLSAIMHGTTFDRYVIVPSDEQMAKRYADNAVPPEQQAPALQCATLGAFGGFFLRGFRAHDYALGRRNAQKFLDTRFVLPAGNPIIKAGLDALTVEAQQEARETFRRKPPGAYSAPRPTRDDGTQSPSAPVSDQDDWIPVIPLCGTAKTTVEHPIREKMSSSELRRIVRLLRKRLRLLGSVFVSQVEDRLLHAFLWPGPYFISFFATPKIKREIIANLGDSYQE